MDELKNILKNSYRYSHFTLLDDTVPFNELFKDQNFDLVQVHSTELIGSNTNSDKDIVGFCGIFEWKNNTLKSLDGDSYNESMNVIGYETITNEKENITAGIDILVGNDW